MNYYVKICQSVKGFNKALLVVVFSCLSFSLQSQLNTDRLMLIGRNALYFEDYVLSIQYFNQIIKVRPHLYDPYFYRSLAKYNLDDYQGALQDCNSCLEINPYLPKVYRLKGDILLRSDKFENAIVSYDNSIEYDADNTGALLNRAICKMRLGQLDDAIIDFNSVIKAKEHLLNAYLALGEIYLQKGDTIQALEDYNKVIEINAYHVNGLVSRGILLYKIDRFEEALEDYNKAIALKPDKEGFYINRALIRYQLNDLNGAMSDYNKVIEMNPNNQLVYFNRAILRADIGDYNNALDDISMVLRFDPDNQIALFNRALLRKNTGDLKRALSDLDQILNQYPKFPPAYYVRSEVKLGLNDQEGAQKDYNTAYALERDNRRQKSNSGNSNQTLAQNNSSAKTTKKATRSQSNKDIRNYKKIVIMDESKEKEKTGFESQVRGKVQNRNISIDLLEIFYVSSFQQKYNLDRVPYFAEEIYQFSDKLGLENELFIVNNNQQLSQTEIDAIFKQIDEIGYAIEAIPEKAKWYNLQGLYQGLVKNYMEAIESFDMALKNDSNNFMAYFFRANARYKMEQFIRSVEDMSDIDIPISLDQSTTEKNKKSNNGIMSKSLNLELVFKDLTKAIHLNPDFAFAWYNRANVRVLMKDYAGAIHDYSKALSLNGELAEAYYNRGLTLIYLGSEKEGLGNISKAGELGIYSAYNVLKRYGNNPK